MLIHRSPRALMGALIVALALPAAQAHVHPVPAAIPRYQHIFVIMISSFR